jgi:hypothetical protein
MPLFYNNTFINMSDISTKLAQAKAFVCENPTESLATGARIYHVNENTTRSSRWRDSQRKGAPTHRGGQNKILSEAQIEAISKYVQDMYLSGLGATKQMVYAAISHLRASQLPPQKPPSWRWFQTFLKAHPELFKVVKTKIQVHGG